MGSNDEGRVVELIARVDEVAQAMKDLGRRLVALGESAQTGELSLEDHLLNEMRRVAERLDETDREVREMERDLSVSPARGSPSIAAFRRRLAEVQDAVASRVAEERRRVAVAALDPLLRVRPSLPDVLLREVGRATEDAARGAPLDGEHALVRFLALLAMPASERVEAASTLRGEWERRGWPLATLFDATLGVLRLADEREARDDRPPPPEHPIDTTAVDADADAPRLPSLPQESADGPRREEPPPGPTVASVDERSQTASGEGTEALLRSIRQAPSPTADAMGPPSMRLRKVREYWRLQGSAEAAERSEEDDRGWLRAQEEPPALRSREPDEEEVVRWWKTGIRLLAAGESFLAFTMLSASGQETLLANLALLDHLMHVRFATPTSDAPSAAEDQRRDRLEEALAQVAEIARGSARPRGFVASVALALAIEGAVIEGNDSGEFTAVMDALRDAAAARPLLDAFLTFYGRTGTPLRLAARQIRDEKGLVQDLVAVRTGVHKVLSNCRGMVFSFASGMRFRATIFPSAGGRFDWVEELVDAAPEKEAINCMLQQYSDRIEDLNELDFEQLITQTCAELETPDIEPPSRSTILRHLDDLRGGVREWHQIADLIRRRGVDEREWIRQVRAAVQDLREALPRRRPAIDATHDDEAVLSRFEWRLCESARALLEVQP